MKDIKAKVVTKPTGKTGGTNGTAKVQAGKAKSSGGVNTPPKGAVPKAMYGKAMMKKGGMVKSKKSC